MRKISKNIEKEINVLKNCRLCPRDCGADRIKGSTGYCRTGAGFYISSIVVHIGEEPVISGKNGICNVFFGHCNLQCKYCQNFQISRNNCLNAGRYWTLEETLSAIKQILDSGVENLGFVSPSHMVAQMKVIIIALNEEGYKPIIVYNTNAYDKTETLRSLEDIVDVYLPDYKYMDPVLASRWSDAADYPETACNAMKEMYRQKGNYLQMNPNGKVEKGLIIRHLVLPGAVENSIKVLRTIASEISNRIVISLMSQYWPVLPVTGDFPLNRKITSEEYNEVVEEMEILGFTRGWVQDHESSGFYLPDFNSPSPFE